MLLRVTWIDQKGGVVCAGMVRGGLCAPILRRHLKGKTLKQIRAYCEVRQWQLEIVEPARGAKAASV